MGNGTYKDIRKKGNRPPVIVARDGVIIFPKKRKKTYRFLAAAILSAIGLSICIAIWETRNQWLESISTYLR